MSDNQPANNQQTENLEEKKEDVISEYYEGVKKLEIQGYETGIKSARNALFVTAGLVLLGEIITASVTGIEFTPLIIGVILIEVGVFVALGFWTKTKPFTAIVTGLILFIVMWIFAIVVNGIEAAYSGIIVKIIIISYLASAIKKAKAWEDAKKS
jgi:hypothetical protein